MGFSVLKKKVGAEFGKSRPKREAKPHAKLRKWKPMKEEPSLRQQWASVVDESKKPHLVERAAHRVTKRFLEVKDKVQRHSNETPTETETSSGSGVAVAHSGPPTIAVQKTSEHNDGQYKQDEEEEQQFQAATKEHHSLEENNGDGLESQVLQSMEETEHEKRSNANLSGPSSPTQEPTSSQALVLAVQEIGQRSRAVTVLPNRVNVLQTAFHRRASSWPLQLVTSMIIGRSIPVQVPSSSLEVFMRRTRGKQHRRAPSAPLMIGPPTIGSSSESSSIVPVQVTKGRDLDVSPATGQAVESFELSIGASHNIKQEGSSTGSDNSQSTIDSLLDKHNYPLLGDNLNDTLPSSPEPEVDEEDAGVVNEIAAAFEQSGKPIDLQTIINFALQKNQPYVDSLVESCETSLKNDIEELKDLHEDELRYANEEAKEAKSQLTRTKLELRTTKASLQHARATSQEPPTSQAATTVADLRAELNNVSKMYINRVTELANSEARYAQLQGHVVNLEISIRARDTALRSSATRNTSLKGQVGILTAFNANMARAVEEARRLHSQNQALTQEITRVKGQLDYMISESLRLQKNCSTWEKQSTDLKSALKVKDYQFEGFQKIFQKMEQEVQATREEMNAVVKSHGLATQEAAAKVSRVETENQILTETVDSLTKSKNEYERCYNGLMNLMTRKVATGTLVHDLEESIHNLQVLDGQQRSELVTLKHTLTETRSDLEESQHLNQSQEQKIKELDTRIFDLDNQVCAQDLEIASRDSTINLLTPNAVTWQRCYARRDAVCKRLLRQHVNSEATLKEARKIVKALLKAEEKDKHALHIQQELLAAQTKIKELTHLNNGWQAQNEGLAWERMAIYIHEDETRARQRENEALRARFAIDLAREPLEIPEESQPDGDSNWWLYVAASKRHAAEYRELDFRFESYKRLQRELAGDIPFPDDPRKGTIVERIVHGIYAKKAANVPLPDDLLGAAWKYGIDIDSIQVQQEVEEAGPNASIKSSTQQQPTGTRAEAPGESPIHPGKTNAEALNDECEPLAQSTTGLYGIPGPSSQQLVQDGQGLHGVPDTDQSALAETQPLNTPTGFFFQEAEKMEGGDASRSETTGSAQDFKLRFDDNHFVVDSDSDSDSEAEGNDEEGDEEGDGGEDNGEDDDDPSAGAAAASGNAESSPSDAKTESSDSPSGSSKSTDQEKSSGGNAST